MSRICIIVSRKSNLLMGILAILVLLRLIIIPSIHLLTRGLTPETNIELNRKINEQISKKNDQDLNSLKFEKDLINSAEIFNAKPETNKLLTLITTFGDALNDTSNLKLYHRYITQKNLLTATRFPALINNVQSVVFSSSANMNNLILNGYANVVIMPEKQRSSFPVPLIKDMMIDAMRISNTTFYMFANGDNLFDHTLINTLFNILKFWNKNILRQKLLIFGHRFNVGIKDIITKDEDISLLMGKSVKNKPFAKDYIIVTRDTMEWELFPDLLIGRQFWDSFVTDYAFHNEIDTIDATDTINLIHQSMPGEENVQTGMLSNPEEIIWNGNLYGVKASHSSIYCATYKLMRENNSNSIMLYQKQEKKIMQNDTKKNYITELLTIIENVNRKNDKNIKMREVTTNLSIIILTYNKPESLKRLLARLSETKYSNSIVNLIIKIDRSPNGLFDLATIRTSNDHIWSYGSKLVILNKEHYGQLHQWLKAIPNNYRYSVLTLILEDDIQLSLAYYKALLAAFNTYNNTSLWINSKLAGYSLHPPIVYPYRQEEYLEIVTQNFADGKKQKLLVDTSNIVLGDFIRSKAFIPNPRVWTKFLKWWKTKTSSNAKPENSFAGRATNRGNLTNWAKHMFAPWFSYFLETSFATPPKVGYFIHKRGNLAVWQYRGLDGSNKFLGFNCSLDKVVIKSKIPLLEDKLGKIVYQFPKDIPKFTISLPYKGY